MCHPLCAKGKASLEEATPALGSEGVRRWMEKGNLEEGSGVLSGLEWQVARDTI